MPKRDDHVLVLGGGLAGVSAAYWLTRAGVQVTIVEREPEVGGLAKSLVHHSEWGDFTYDIGPHRFHTTDPRVHEETMRVLGDNKVKRARVSRILLYGRFFDYPLKLGAALTQLPKTVMFSAITSYFWQATKNLFTRARDDSFESWVVRRFGRKLFQIFFGVYTEKTWGVPCTAISADWAAQRISQSSLWDTIKKSLFRPKGDVRGLVSEFHYPKTGGVGSIARSYRRASEEAGAEVFCSTTVRRVILEGGRAVGAEVEDADGNRREIRADFVLNTMPLTKLVELAGAPDSVVEHAKTLEHRSMVFVYVMVDREQVTHDHWLYIPESKLTMHRLSEFKNFSEECAPEGKTLVCCEITCNFGDEVWNKPDEELRQIATKDLLDIGLINEGEVLGTFTHREIFAYPLYTIGYREHQMALIRWADGVEGLDTTGRQGLFKYNNMDHSIGMGFAAADNFLGAGASHRKVGSGDEYYG